MRHLQKWLGFTMALSLVLCWAASLRAQNQGAVGTVLGHVQDASGAAVPGAKVTLRNEQTGITVSFTTGSAGDYIFVNQIPDTYDVTVAKSGFKTATTQDLVLQVEQTLRQDFTLEVGSETQQVNVSASGPMLQTDNTTIGEVIDQRTIAALPLNGRDYTTLLTINAGVTEPSGGIQTSIFDQHGLNPHWAATSVDGQRTGSTSYMVDGISNTDMFFSKAMNLISADAIQEFKLENGLYSAASGFGSAQVNVAIKSGTNQLHGTAYDYWENQALQPANLINKSLNDLHGTRLPVTAPFNQNQFGFTLGGPMVIPKIYNGRNKTFWFVAYEGGREVSSGGGASFAQVPTAQERNGDFSDWPYPIYNPATTGSLSATVTNPTGRAVFPNNTIPSSMFNPIAQKWLNYFPLPNVSCALPCPNYSQVLESSIITDTVNSRIDHTLTNRDQLSGTFLLSRDIPTFPSLFPASASTAFTRTRLLGLDYVHDFSPTAINDFRAGYDRENFHEGSITAFGPNLSQQLGFANTTPLPSSWGLPGLGLADGYGGPGNNNNGYSQVDNIFEYADNLSLIHGKHTITFGTDDRRYQLYDTDAFTANGQVNFIGSYTAANPALAGKPGPTSGNAMADFLLGYPFSERPPLPLASDVYSVRGWYWSFFAQDDFHATPRLTMNLGLRYEIPESFHSVTNDGSIINPSTPAGGGLIWASNSVTKLVSGAPFASTYYQCCTTNQLVPTDYRDLAPRIGLAWRPLRNNDRLVLRTGYGIFYDVFDRFYDLANYDSNLLSLLFPNPNYPVATGLEKASPLALNTLWLPPISLSPTSVPPPYEFGIQTEWPNNVTPYTQQWSFDAQYQFTNNLMLDIGYVGAHALNLPQQWEFNAASNPTVPGDPCNRVVDRSQASAACLADPNFQPVDTRDPFPNFAPNSYANAQNLYSNYNALQVRLEKRFSQGLQFDANYTYSRAFDAGISGIAAFGDQFNLIMNPHNFASQYGPASFDEPQRFVLSYLYEVPVGKGQKFNLGKANAILGGWNWSGVLNLGSGFPFSVYCCPRSTPVNQTGQPFGDSWYPNLVGNPHSGTQSILQWFNPAAYTTPEIGTFGNVARNPLRGPWMHQTDFSFMKNFQITERHSLQFRLDIFNAFSSSYSFLAPHLPDNRLSDSPVNCTPGPAGTCAFGSLVPLNGIGATNLWNPRVLQFSLRYLF
jgi:hypothetical protein